MPPNNWKEELNVVLLEMFKPKEKPSKVAKGPVVGPKPNKISYFKVQGPPLGLIIILGICILIFAGNKIKKKPVLPVAPSTIQPSETELLKSEYAKLDGKADKLWNKGKITSDKVNLLAIVNNHNYIVIRDGHPRSELILINSDWTISQFPKYVQMTDEEKKYVNQFVKP